ncbi:uncharacterized protein LOC135373388 [Ornithodoros turicata]|uniref:uncharacterized protein LOC135373388 n=1 Tax=Ornithodoros turicata TaxID=34597 RepID=UPI003138A5E6
MHQGDPPPSSSSTGSLQPNSDGQQHHVGAIAVKLPAYWDRNPAIWFAQADAQFHLAGVTAQTTRFYHVISALSPAAAEEVQDLIISPPTQNAYDQLKSALLKRTSASDHDRLRQLLSAQELGDRRPTQLLRRMKQLLGDDAPQAGDKFLRQLFMQRLPNNVQMVLAAAANLPIDELATLADAVMEVASSTSLSVLEQPATQTRGRAVPPAISPIPEACPSVSQPTPATETILQQVNSLTQLVATLVARPRSPSPRRPRFRRGSPSPRRSRSRSANQDGLCWYHHRFGAEAHHCLLPCSWTGNPPGPH